jgi:Anti-sigma-K factor rskA
MTTAEHRIPGGGAERPPAEPAGQRQAGAHQWPAAANPWRRRVSFWRSVAGMAIALALGCAAVALENASELSSRSMNFHRRVELLGSQISRLRSEISDAGRQLAAMRAQQFAHANLNRVLSAPDVMVLHLTPGPGTSAHGLVALSRQAGDAILEVAELSAAAGHTCVMWWLLAPGPPAKAAEFNPDVDERLSLTIRMPPRGAKIVGAIITLEPGKSPDKPNGRIMLRGVLPRPQVLS